MNPTPSDVRADVASGSAGDGPGNRAQRGDDTEVRHRLRPALERELAIATAAGDQATRERLLAALRRTVTT